MTYAAIVFLVLLGLLSALQLSLVLGMPLGRLAWGGKHKKLPLKLRVGSAFSLLIYAAFAALVVSKLGIVNFVPDERVLNVGLWTIIIYLALGIILNLASRSRPERHIMAPAATVLASCAYIVMLG